MCFDKILKDTVYIPLVSVECGEHPQCSWLWHKSCDCSQTQTSSTAASKPLDDALWHISTLKTQSKDVLPCCYKILKTPEKSQSSCFFITHISSIRFGVTLFTVHLVFSAENRRSEIRLNAIHLIKPKADNQQSSYT